MYKNAFYGCCNLLALLKSAWCLGNLRSCQHCLWWRGVSPLRDAKALRAHRRGMGDIILGEGSPGFGNPPDQKKAPASSQGWGQDSTWFGNTHPKAAGGSGRTAALDNSCFSKKTLLIISFFMWNVNIVSPHSHWKQKLQNIGISPRAKGPDFSKPVPLFVFNFVSSLLCFWFLFCSV